MDTKSADVEQRMIEVIEKEMKRLRERFAHGPRRPNEMQVDEALELHRSQQQDGRYMDFYPLLPETSVLIRGYEIGDAGVAEGAAERHNRYVQYTHAIYRADAENGGTGARLIDCMNIFNARLMQEMQWQYETELVDAVLAHHDRHVVAYWERSMNAAATRALTLLCSRSPLGRMLVPDEGAEKRFPFMHTYGEALAKDGGESVLMHDHGQPPGIIYMLWFTPQHLVKVRARFPDARLVGVTLGSVANHEAMRDILRARQSMRSSVFDPGEKEGKSVPGK